MTWRLYQYQDTITKSWGMLLRSIFNYEHACVCLYVGKYVWMQVGTPKVQDRVLDPLEIQLWAAVSLLIQVLRTKLWSSVWAVHALLLSHLHSPPPPQILSYTRNPYRSTNRQVRYYQNGILSVTHKQCVCICTCVGASFSLKYKDFYGTRERPTVKSTAVAEAQGLVPSTVW